MVEEIDTQIPEYEADTSESWFYYNGRDKLRKSRNQNFVVPCFKENGQDWDAILMGLLNNCNKSIIKTKQFEEEILDIADDIFVKYGVFSCKNIIAHPDNEFKLHDVARVFVTEHCPNNMMFILPPPELIGVVPCNKLEQKQGMAIVDSRLVIKVKLPTPQPKPHISLLDALIML